MKVLILQSGNYLENGSLNYSITSRRQVEALSDSGIDMNVELVTSRTSPKGIQENIKRLQKIINHLHPDLIHAHYGSMVGYIASKVAGEIPLVISFCGDDLLGTPNPGIRWRIREKIARFLSLKTASKAKQIVTKSLNLKKSLPLKYQSKVSVIPNGINSQFFHIMDRSNCRNTLNWGKEPVIFFNGSSGSNSKVKNIELALETIRELKKDYPTARLEKVSNVSPEELRIRMCASDCVLVTSLHEGSPNIVKEALASNIPVVSVDCGDVAQRLATVNKGGFYDYDAKQLAASIKDILKSDSAFNGRDAFFKQELDEKSVSQKLIGVYQSAIQLKQPVTSLN